MSDLGSRMIAIAALLVLAAIGFARVGRRLAVLTVEESFAHEYFQRFQDFMRSAGKDLDAYTWLTRHSARMQDVLGPWGFLSSYHRPFTNIMYENVPVTATLLPDLYRELNQSSFGPHAPTVAVLEQALQECLVRHSGVREGQIKAAMGDLKNPFVWFREGVGFVLALPFSLLGWLGVVSIPSVQRVGGSPVARGVKGILSLLALAASVITICTGWGPFVAQLRSLVP